MAKLIRNIKSLRKGDIKKGNTLTQPKSISRKKKTVKKIKNSITNESEGIKVSRKIGKIKEKMKSNDKMAIKVKTTGKIKKGPIYKKTLSSNVEKKSVTIKNRSCVEHIDCKSNEENWDGKEMLKIKVSNFDEQQFGNIVSLENIKKVCKALKKLVENEVREKATAIFRDYRYFLNISSFKIPNCPKRMVKLNLEHSLVDINTDDIAIIVPDLQRGAKINYELTVKHYEDFFRENKIVGLKIIPFNQLRVEYTSFEAKRKLANTYDFFLCDGRIVGHVVGFCGKHFQRPRTTIHAVHLSKSNTCKKNIEHALKRTSYKQLHKGDLISIPFGNHRFTVDQLAENVKLIIDQLKVSFPGGFANIRNIYIKIDIKGTSSLPLFINMASAPTETPNVVGPREIRMLNMKKRTNEIISEFNLSKSGNFVKLTRAEIKNKNALRTKRAELSKNVKVKNNHPSSKINIFKTNKQIK